MTSPFAAGGPFSDLNAINTDLVESLMIGGDVLNRDTDRANAQDFTHMFGDRILWTPEGGWYIYDEIRWRPDTLAARSDLIGSLADHLSARARIVEDDAERNILRARVRRLEGSGGLAGALKYAESMNAKSLTEMDQNPYLLNCLNGTLDVRTGTMVKRDPGNFITRLAPTAYDPDAVDAVWEKVRHEGFGEDKDQMNFFRRYMGYSLTGDYTMKKFLAMHGPSDAGKSSLVEPFALVLGDVAEGGYTTSWDAEVLQADAQINRYEKLDKARSARLILVGELEKGKRMADGFVKKFTGGNAMDAKALYKGSYTYKPQAKLILDTNYVPKSADPAVHNRLILLPMTHVPKHKDPLIKAHLEESDSAHRAILAWAVKGAKEWWDTRSLGELPWMASALQKYVKSSDVLVNFVDDCFESTDVLNECVPVTTASAMYVAWCYDEGSKAMQRRTWTDAMEERGHLKHRLGMGGATILTGIKVKPLDELSETVRAAVISGKWTGQSGT
jgi:putative DNA primase/helicase